MKKVLIVVLLVSVLLLAGCNKNAEVNNNVNNDVPEVVTDNQQQENVDDNANGQNEIEQYKLIDGYVLTDDLYEEIKIDDIEFDFSEESTHDDKFQFVSDNTEYTITAPEAGIILLNDKEISGHFAKVVDFNIADNYKELIVGSIGSWHDGYTIYRVKANNELEIINEFEDFNLIKIGDKYIFPQYIGFIKEKVPYGYYEYIDDKFVYVDRFLNGEKIAELGYFSDVEYTTKNTQGKIVGGACYPIYENESVTDKFLADDSKIKILNIKVTSSKKIELIDIEITEDSVIYQGKVQAETSDMKPIPVEAGTKLTILFMRVG